MDFDNLDRDLLNIIQSDFPVVSDPFRELADRLGTTEEDVLARLRRLTGAKTIRRLGGIFDSRKLGYTGTLCAMRVPEEKIGFVSGIVNGYPGVTHNYLRNHHFNMWFTLLVPEAEEIERVMEEIKDRTGLDEIVSLPATRLFKIKVNFDLTEG